MILQCLLRLDFLIILTEVLKLLRYIHATNFRGITHQDFAGHKGTIHTGDVQWMTTGRGIIHSEMPAGEGVHKGLQLWMNLSSQEKMNSLKNSKIVRIDAIKARDVCKQV